VIGNDVEKPLRRLHFVGGSGALSTDVETLRLVGEDSRR
jgi:hypothetical protein